MNKENKYKCRINLQGQCDDECICHCEGCYNSYTIMKQPYIIPTIKIADNSLYTNIMSASNVNSSKTIQYNNKIEDEDFWKSKY